MSAAAFPRSTQLDLFASVAAAYAGATDGILDNATLYDTVARHAGIDSETLNARVPIGKAKALRSPIKQRVRWYQQALRQLNIIQKVEGERGLWRLTESVGKGLHRAAAGVNVVAFSTSLGVAVWGRSQEVYGGINEPIALAISSPPFLLRQPRAYGGVADEVKYVDFLCEVLEPIVRNLLPGGSVVLNLTNDAHEPGLPSRSLYLAPLAATQRPLGTEPYRSRALDQLFEAPRSDALGMCRPQTPHDSLRAHFVVLQ